MKKTCLLAAMLVATSAPAFAQTGNGAPSGSHYNLNIIGFDKAKKADLTDSHRHTIFVALDFHDATPTDPTPIAELNRKNKIFLQEGPFQVIDGNAWDGALFQLPAPGCEIDGTDVDESTCDYAVYVRGLGSPQGNPYANMTTCQKGDLDTTLPGDEFQCSTETITVSRLRGKSTFDNVTKELLTLCLDTDGDQVCDTRTQLFDEELFSYFWDYDNFGLRLAQLRFYPKNP